MLVHPHFYMCAPSNNTNISHLIIELTELFPIGRTQPRNFTTESHSNSLTGKERKGITMKEITLSLGGKHKKFNLLPAKAVGAGKDKVFLCEGCHFNNEFATSKAGYCTLPEGIRSVCSPTNNVEAAGFIFKAVEEEQP
jgi:hypothetical protein